MRCFPMRFFRSVNGRNKSGLHEYSEEELDEQGMRDLEATIAESSGFIVLKGERLSRRENRLEELAEVFRKTAVVPVDTPVPLESRRRTNIPAMMGSRSTASDAVPGSRSMNSADDQPYNPAESDPTYLTASSRCSSIQSPENDAEDDKRELVQVPTIVMPSSHDSIVRTPQEDVDNGTLSAAVGVAEVADMDSVSIAAAAVAPIEETNQNSLRSPLVDDSPMYAIGQPQKMQELESEVSGDEEIPAALLSNSVQGDSVLPDTATTVDAMTLSDMNDWNRFRPLTSFSDFNTPLPMKVHGFIDLQTQSVASSRREDEVDRSLQPRTPEKDHSTTDGLLFSIDSFDMPRRNSKRASSALNSSPESDLDGEETVLSRLTEQAMIRARHFKASRMSVMPNFPVNVWDDVAPTRLHAQLVDVSMDQDFKLLSAMH